MGSFDSQPVWQPVLGGALVRLRPLQKADFEALFQVASDPLIWEQHPERFRYQREVFERFFQAAMDSKGALLVLDAKTDEVIGSSRFCAFDPEKKRVEVGYTFLARKVWGLGYNTELKRLMLAHAFRYVNQVLFYIGEENLRSRKAVEKIGAKLLDTIQRQPKEGAVYTATIYGISKAEFLSAHLEA